MTTPSDPHGAQSPDPIQTPAAAPAEATPAPPMVGPTDATPDVTHVVPADAFAPVARPPRVPWVNPARRGRLAAAAVTGAVVFAAAGVFIGHAITGHPGHPEYGGEVRIAPFPGQGLGGYGPGQALVPGSTGGRGIVVLPGGRLPDRLVPVPGSRSHAAKTTPAPTPSGSATS